MAAIRWILGRLILLFDWLFQPKGVERDPELQSKFDIQSANLALYQYKACPFCVKVRRAIKRNSLNIEVRDAKIPLNKDELHTQGGQPKVPCLRIQEADKDIWLYESSDIIQYLEQRFA